MVTKGKELDKLAKDYIVDCIDSSGYGIELENDSQKVKFLFDTFLSEYGWAIGRYGRTRAFTEWIQGLPSSFNIEFTNSGIIELAQKWGSLPENPTEKQEDKILDNYWNFITAKAFQLFRKHGVTQ